MRLKGLPRFKVCKAGEGRRILLRSKLCVFVFLDLSQGLAVFKKDFEVGGFRILKIEGIQA